MLRNVAGRQVRRATASAAWHDVVVVGGGVVGMSTAHWLKRLEPSCRVCVVEKDPTYCRAASALSAGGLRKQFSNVENIDLSHDSYAFLRDADEYLGEGTREELCFRENGYLLMASTDEGARTLAENAELQRSRGAQTRVLSPDEMVKMWPWMSREGVTAASWGEREEGWLDPNTLLRLFRKRCAAMGCDFVTAAATGVELKGKHVSRVHLSTGDSLPLGTLVNAAGPAAASVASWVNVSLPVVPRKRYTYMVQANVDIGSGRPMPLIVDPSGVWARPEGVGFICGVSPPEGEDPDVEADDFDVKEEAQQRWEDLIWPALAGRMEGMEACKLVTQWAGHYDYNTVDQNGIIGMHPNSDNTVFANGFSGHGLQQSPAVGRAVAELILYGKFASRDLSGMRPTRFEEGHLLLERNVV